jgi:hypothetical protein
MVSGVSFKEYPQFHQDTGNITRLLKIIKENFTKKGPESWILDPEKFIPDPGSKKTPDPDLQH